MLRLSTSDDRGTGCTRLRHGAHNQTQTARAPCACSSQQRPQLAGPPPALPAAPTCLTFALTVTAREVCSEQEEMQGDSASEQLGRKPSRLGFEGGRLCGIAGPAVARTPRQALRRLLWRTGTPSDLRGTEPGPGDEAIGLISTRAHNAVHSYHLRQFAPVQNIRNIDKTAAGRPAAGAQRCATWQWVRSPAIPACSPVKSILHEVAALHERVGVGTRAMAPGSVPRRRCRRRRALHRQPTLALLQTWRTTSCRGCLAAYASWRWCS